MTISSRKPAAPPWLLLVFSLPRKGASLRVAVWRTLQRNGALPLGNSGYLLPNAPANRERFEWLAVTIRTEHGEASIVEVQSIDNCSDLQLRRRFSEARAGDYRELLNEVRRIRTSAKRSRASIIRLRRRLQMIVSMDFFGSRMREDVERALQSLERPNAESVSPPPVNVARAAYRNRLWVTRPRPGVDRVTSAWLIRKFIDPRARFTFAKEDQKPAQAVPFDMFEGGFGHRGEDCTFETLVKAFRIRDRGVRFMAEIVHDADLFDEKFGRNEGLGIDEVMKGWARQGLEDRELLSRGIQLASGLHDSLR